MAFLAKVQENIVNSSSLLFFGPCCNQLQSNLLDDQLSGWHLRPKEAASRYLFRLGSRVLAACFTVCCRSERTVA